MNSSIFRFFVSAMAGIATTAFGAEYHISTSGSDTAEGSATAPWKTISKAAGLMQPGDVCRIHAGTYRETVRPQQSGSEGKPIVFEAFGDGEVVVHGGELVEGWSFGENGIYTAPVKEPVGDLFVNGETMMLACYPNQPYSPNSGFDRLQWVGGTASLPKSVDIRGAFALRPAMSWTIQKVDTWEDIPRGVIMGALGLLDAEGEWLWKDGTLFLKPVAGKNPELSVVERKVRDYGFDLSSRTYVEVKGIKIFGASLNLDAASHCLIKSCQVFYHCPFFTVKNSWRAGLNSIATWGKGVVLGGDHNVLRGCEIAHSWGDGVTLYGSNNTIERCHIYDCDWSGTDAALVGVSGGGHRIHHNTLHDCGRTGILARGATAKSSITYNDVYRYGYLTFDLGGIYIGWRDDSKGLEVAYNWFHDSRVDPLLGGNSGPGIYSDGNYNGIWHHNVVWNVGGVGLQVNPRDFLPLPSGEWEKLLEPYANMEVYNNTCLNSGLDGVFHGGKQLKVYNNILLTDSCGDDRRNNLIKSSAFDTFADPYSGDFRLKKGSPALDSGISIPGVTDGFTQTAPDVGAYEFGGEEWVPGAHPKAFSPIPGRQLPRPSISARFIRAIDVDEYEGKMSFAGGLGHLNGGDWVCYRGVNFGSGASICHTNVAVDEKHAGGRVEFRLDNLNGTLIGTLTVANTGSFNKYAQQPVPISKTSGTHDLYMLFKGGVGIGTFTTFSFE
jgi:Carbohydrate binding module (family 6)/Right handed beta helix region/Protein of unknown function (DUF1565)